MARKIDTSDPSKLSLADRRYLQDRGQHIALGLPPLPTKAPQAAPLGENTGDAGVFPPPSTSADTAPGDLTGDNDHSDDTTYDDLGVKQLRALIDVRNESRSEEDRLSKGGSKDDLIARLRSDDDGDTIEED